MAIFGSQFPFVHDAIDRVTHLSDQVGTFCVLALDRLEEFRRARPGDGPEVLLELFLGHTNTRVCTRTRGTTNQLSPLRCGSEKGAETATLDTHLG